MISADFVKKLAIKKQATELNVLREYLQHLFLAYFYQERESNQILFKGGTALKIVYDSPRFSEDLDFSAKTIGVKKIEEILTETLTKIERESVKVQINEAKTTSGGYLAIYRGVLLGQEIKIQLEISFRRKAPSGEAALIAQEFVPPYTLIHLSEKELVSEKIKALLERSKARDWYDLYFILRERLEIDFGTLGLEKESLKELLLEKLNRAETVQIARELKPLLPISHQAILKNFKENLQREIKRRM